MKRKHTKQPNWRELAIYSTLAAGLAIASASISTLFVF